MTSTTRIALGIVSCITTIIFIIAIMQLELVTRLEDHDDINNGGGGGGGGGGGINDGSKEAIMLRLGLIRPEIVSWSPRVIHFHNFLSYEECDYLIALATPRLRTSNVIDRSTGRGVPSQVRTSSSMFLSPKEKKNPIIEAIETRISIYSQVPADNGESLQIIRYEKGQHYLPHNDYFSDKFNVERGGQRVATVLMYLSDVIEGGETYFPRADSDNCTCGGKIVSGLSVKPVKGNAVLFWSLGLNGESDTKSVHGGCDVVTGVKWSATKWMREQPRLTINPKVNRSVTPPFDEPSV